MLVAAPPVAAQEGCFGDLASAGVEPKPGPPIRFGITPSGEAGQIGPVPSTFAPDDPAKSSRHSRSCGPRASRS